MSLAPRVVLVHRVSEYEELLARHGTHGQAAFVLGSRGDDLDTLAGRHHATRDALTAIAARIPLTWRQARVERADLDRFLFAPEDIVVVAGQDGLVANVAQYLHGQPVIGIDTDPGRNPGVLVRHRPGDAAALLRAAAGPRVTTDALTMARGRHGTTAAPSSRSTRSMSARRATAPPATASAPGRRRARRRRPARGSSSAPVRARAAGCARCGRSAAPRCPCRARPRTASSGTCARRGPPRRPACSASPGSSPSAPASPSPSSRTTSWPSRTAWSRTRST
ncbi:conserved hypothetical protein [Streptomyces sp. SPB78]|nr:conserved hypothetical protein [Streptomyces sp. SPB78]